jgi:hypothetical protein
MPFTFQVPMIMKRSAIAVQLMIGRPRLEAKRDAER